MCANRTGRVKIVTMDDARNPNASALAEIELSLHRPHHPNAPVDPDDECEDAPPLDAEIELRMVDATDLGGPAAYDADRHRTRQRLPSLQDRATVLVCPCSHFGV